MALPGLLSRLAFPATTVFVLAGLSCAASGFYTGLGVEQPPLFSLLLRVGWLWAIGWWLTDDLDQRRARWFYCKGLFLVLAWPFMLPYYLLQTRGTRALIAIAGLVGLSIFAVVIGIVIGAVLASY